MRSINVAVLCAIVVIAAASTASAGDMALPAPVYKAPGPPVVINTWTGFYIGGHAGWGWGHDPSSAHLAGNDCDLTTGVCNVPPVSVSGINSKGFVGGFQAGYNQQWANLVGGLEIDVSGADIKGSTSNSVTTAVATPGGTFIGTQSATLQDKFETLGSVRARVGYLILPDLLLYGTGGLSFSHFVQNTTNAQNEIAPFVCVGLGCGGSQTNTASTPLWLFGWVAGVGGEYRILGSNWLARVEYLHYDFGNSPSFSATSTVAGGPPLSFGNTSGGHLSVDVVRGGISFKFGGP